MISLIEKALERALPPSGIHPPEIHEAMRYAVLNGGKRFRPSLVLAACRAVGGSPRPALLAASAVELIHAYSLVHDDLPALDNDEMRRGKPTCHRKFGEALAILAGDALLTRAFELLSQVRPAAKAIRLIQELSQAAGTGGMIGGQVLDIRFSAKAAGGTPDLATLETINRHKTGRLIEASVMLGALVGTHSDSPLRKMRRFGRSLGLAFQVVDDIMDGDGYLRLMEVSEARQKAEKLIQSAKREAESFGKRGKELIDLANLLLERIPSPNYVSAGHKSY